MSNTVGRAPQRSALSRIGETYGSLTILDIVGRNERGVAICSARCECGSEKDYDVSKLAKGQTKSCGCLSSSTTRTPASNHIGETINGLTLTEVIKNKNGTKGKFLCECGNEKISYIGYWKSGGMKSCGCKKSAKPKKAHDRIGDKFHKLTLLEVTGQNKRYDYLGKFQCDCGNIKDGIKVSDVVLGTIKSCGCLQNKAEDAIGTTWGNLRLLEVTQKTNYAKGITKTKGIFECGLCGKSKHMDVASVKSGVSTDCGCSKFHKLSYHKSYRVYHAMIERCTNPLRRHYANYGRRGVKVCDRWMEPNGQGLINFMADVGNDRPSKKHSLHRMWKYNDENKLVEMMEYGPDTVKWATARQQAVEQRSPKLKKRVAEFEKLLDKGYSIVQMAEEMKLKPQKVEFFLSIMGLLEGYEYKEDEK